jgi:hypothetical protein
MQRFVGTVYDSGGLPMTGVLVTVKKAGTAVNASLYSDDGITTKSNGFTNDSDSSFEFYAPNGRYDVVFTKSGQSFTDTNSTDLVIWDPRDDSAAVVCRNEFQSIYIATNELIADGQHWVKAGGVVSVVGDATYQNGWIDVIETGGVAGSIFLANNGSTIQLLWAPGTDVITLDMRVEKVGDAVTGTRRVGLSSANLTSGDPTNGIYVRQIDANNAFLVCRASATETLTDLGQTLNAITRIRVTITTSSVRAFVDDVAKTPATTNIPTAIMGLSAAGGATATAGGLRLDYLNVYRGLRI